MPERQPPRPRVAVRSLAPAGRAAAEGWARRLGLPLLDDPASAGDEGVDAWLEVGGEGLALRLTHGPAVRVTPRAAVRRAAGARDLLLRAVGKVASGATVVDATAGLGGDAFQLAAHGLRVVLFERSELVAALLEDGLERAAAGREGPAAAGAAARMRLVRGDARTLLPSLEPGPDVVVLDPMYPRTGKSALPGKGMALFRTLLGPDLDAAGLLEVAISVARRRVVVKRPRRAPALGPEGAAPRPSGSVVGTTTRFDIYAGARPST